MWKALKCKFRNAKLLISGGALLLDDLYKTQRHSGKFNIMSSLNLSPLSRQATLSVLDNMDSGEESMKQTEEEVARKFGFEEYFIEG